MRYGLGFVVLFLCVMFAGCVVETTEPGGCWDDRDCYSDEYCGEDGYCYSESDNGYSSEEEPACWEAGWECATGDICADDGYCYIDDGGCWYDSDCSRGEWCEVSTGDCLR